MTTLDRYVLTRVLRAFLPALLGLALVFFVAGASRLLRDEDLSLRQIALALPTLLPYLLPYLLPVAYALGGALALTRLVDQREVLALTALGISRRTLLRPAWLLALPLAGASLLIGAQVAPAAYRLRRQVAKAILLQLGQGQHVSRTHGALGLRLYAREVRGQTLRGLVVQQHDARRERSVQLVASQAALTGHEDALTLALRDVDLTVLPGPRPDAASRSRGGPVRIRLPRFRQPLNPGEAGPTRLRVEAKSSTELLRLARAAPPRDPQDTRFKARLELGYRLVLGLAPLAIGWTAFPLVLRLRRPLIACSLGVVAGCGATFGPLLLARSLAELLRQPAWLWLGVLAPALWGLLLTARLEASR